MGSIQLLLGRTRERRQRAIPADHVSGVDTFGRPTFLYVTDTRRKAREVEREFLCHREIVTFAPQVRVLDELIEALHLRHGDGRAWMSRRLRGLVAERLIAEGRWPWLAALAKHRPWPVAEALAELEQQLAEAREEIPSGVPHRAEIAEACHALRARLSAVPGRVAPAAALEGLLDRLGSPPEALVGWLRATSTVVVDDVLHQSPLRTAVLSALCQAWAAAGAHVVVAFESGRGQGGREAAAFFDYDEVAGISGALKPFAASRGLRRALFEELVAVGSGAAIRVALAGHTVDADSLSAAAAPSDPTSGDPSAPEGTAGAGLRDATPRSSAVAGAFPEGDDEPPDVTDRCWEPGPPLPVPEGVLPSEALLRGRVRFVAHADAESEARHVVAEAKEALLAGEAPGGCLIAVAGLSASAPMWRAALEDAGVPFAMGVGQPLAEAPVARLVLRMARVALDGLPAAELLGIFATDLVRVPEGIRVDRLVRQARAAGVRSGPPSSWLGALSAWNRRSREPEPQEAMVAELARLELAAAPLVLLAEPCTPAQLRQRLLEAASVLGVPDRLARCPDPEVALDGLQAWGALLRCLDEVVIDLAAVDPSERPASERVEALERAVAATRWRVADAGVARLPVVDVREMRGLTPRRAWVAGLSRGVFPRAEPGSFLIPRAARRELGGADPLWEARYLLASAVRNAVHTDGMRLVVSWPLVREGAAVAPSSVVADLLAVPIAGGRALAEVVEHSGPRPVVGRSADARSAAIGPSWQVLLPEADRPLLAAQRAAVEARSADALGPWDGLVGPLPEPPDSLRVTSLERYLRCPARYAYAEVLGLRPDVSWEPEVDAARRGSAVHRILERFYRDRRMAPVQGLDGAAFSEAAGRLRAVAEAVFEEVASEGGFEAPYLAFERDRWMAGLVDARPAGILRAWLDAEVAFPAPLVPVGVEDAAVSHAVGPVRVRGRIDRIDRVAGGLLVTDYKTGAAPTVDDLARGLALQPIVYAEAVGARSPGSAVGAVYQELTRPDGVARKAWSGDRALLERLATGRAAKLPLDPAGRQRLLAHAARGAERLRDGRFHTTFASPAEAGCASCDFRRICRTDPERAANIADPEAQRPLDPG